MKKYFFKNKKTLFLYLILSPVMAITSVLFASTLEPLINSATTKDVSLITRMIIIFVLIVVADVVISYMHKIVRENLRKEFLIGFKRDLFIGIMNKSFDEYRKESPAYYISMMQRDVKKVSTDYFDSICGIYRVCTSFIVTVVALIKVNPFICLINVMIAMLSIFIPRFFSKILKTNSSNATEAAAEYQSIVSDAFIGFNTIRLYSVLSRVIRQTEERNIACEEAECKLNKTNYRISYMSIVCTEVGFVMTILSSIIFLYLGKISLGAVLALTQLIGGILAPFQEVPIFITNLKSADVIIKKLLDNTGNESEIEEENINIGENYSLVAQDVNMSYEGKDVLKEVNIRFQQGKKYIIMGESGCGKSSLVKLFLKMAECNKGEVFLGDRNISEIPDKQLYSTINYMQQEVFLFDDTIKNNITLFRDYTNDQLETAIENSGLKEYINSLELGLETRINGNGYNLSGGEKQRIGIARALLTGAKVFVFDEITSNLDVKKERFIENLIMSLNNITVILITHRINGVTLSSADEIIVMKEGKICEQGKYQDLMNAKGLLYGYNVISGNI